MLRVLLVDDSSSNRLVLGSLLEDEGMHVVVADSFADAHAKVTTAEASSYDVVLLDLHLGDGLGTDLVPVMRERMPKTKILLISGSSTDAQLPSSLALDGALEKGAEFSELLALVNRVVRASLPPAPTT